MLKSNYLIRVVDDDEEFLDAVVFLLKTEGWTAAAFSSPEQFLDRWDERPGCVILDMRMAEMSGLDVFERIKEKTETLPVVFLTGHGDIDLAVHVFREGACDFLQKPVTKEALIRAVTRAVGINDSKRRALEKDSPASLYSGLTDREKDVIRDVAKLLSNKAIGEHYGISERTVEFHRASAMKKMRIRKPEEARKLLLSLGVL